MLGCLSSNRWEVGLASVDECIVDFDDLVVGDCERPAIYDYMVRKKERGMPIIRQADEGERTQRSCGQIEWLTQSLANDPLCFLFTKLRRNMLKVEILKLRHKAINSLSNRIAVLFGKTHAQRIVPFREQSKSFNDKRRHNDAFNPGGRSNIESRTQWIKPVQEPQPLLRIRQGKVGFLRRMRPHTCRFRLKKLQDCRFHSDQLLADVSIDGPFGSINTKLCAV